MSCNRQIAARNLALALALALAPAPALLLGANTKRVNHKPNSQCTLVLPADEEQTDILSTDSISTTSSAVQPLNDTYCIAGSGDVLICQGIDKPTSVRLSGADELNVLVEGSVCFTTYDTSLAPSEKDDRNVTDESTSVLEEVVEPVGLGLDCEDWNINWHQTIKTEPSDTASTESDGQEYNALNLGAEVEVSSVGEQVLMLRTREKTVYTDVREFVSSSKPGFQRPNSKKTGRRCGVNITCQGCGREFISVSKRTAHCRGSHDPGCKGKLNTTCKGCRTEFKSVSDLESHCRRSSDPGCKGGRNTTCQCGKIFDTVNQFKGHCYKSTSPCCRGGRNTNCKCGLTFKSAAELYIHRRRSKSSVCKGKLTTAVGVFGQEFTTASQLKKHSKRHPGSKRKRNKQNKA